MPRNPASPSKKKPKLESEAGHQLQIPLERIVKASPTKEFFLFMLTRDLDILDAVGDLVDNCVDGARRTTRGKKGPKPLDGLWVRIEADKNHFRIRDNCGGIDVDLARNYAFRFGRVQDYDPGDHSIGQFGVGMKRALFKMGNIFTVDSKTQTTRFLLRQNLQEWLQKPEDQWDLEFAELDEKYKGPDKGTTTIEVTHLHKNIQEEFSVANKLTRIRDHLLAIHEPSLKAGLAISINKTPLEVSPAELLKSEDVEPAKKTMTLTEDGMTVKVVIYAGLVSQKQATKDGHKKAGWYVYCNGRLVLPADQDFTTGWDDALPKFHPEYNRFRGYAFFDSDTPKVLPWTTTKSGVNFESGVFQKARLEMMTMARPIISFLGKLKEERRKMKEDAETETEIQMDKKAKSVQLSTVNSDQGFKAPPVTPKASDLQEISFFKPKSIAKKAKDKMNVRSYSDVGSACFDYYCDAELDG